MREQLTPHSAQADRPARPGGSAGRAGCRPRTRPRRHRPDASWLHRLQGGLRADPGPIVRQRVSRPCHRSARAVRIPGTGRRGIGVRAARARCGLRAVVEDLARPGRWCCSGIPSAAWSPAARSWPRRGPLTHRRSDPAVLRTGGLQVRAPVRRAPGRRAHHAGARQGRGLRQHGGRRPGGPQDRAAGRRRTAPPSVPAVQSGRAARDGRRPADRTRPGRRAAPGAVGRPAHRSL